MLTFLVLAAGILAEMSTTKIMELPLMLEGKELRFGQISSTIWAMVSSLANAGAVNSSFDSLAPLTTGVIMLAIILSEAIFGGVGTGLYGLFYFTILAVFLSGLMVGRTPEYLGKKIEVPEIRLTVLGVLVPSTHYSSRQ